MRKRITLAATAFVAGAALVLTGCAGDNEPTTEPDPGENSFTDGECPMPETMTTATVATNPGAQDMVIKHVKAGGFDTRYNLDLQVQEFLNPPATAQAIVQKAVDLGFGGVPTMVQARAAGSDVIVIGAFATPGNGMFVKPDSDIQSISDLDDRMVGSFTSLNGAITSLMQAYAQSAYGFNMLEDVQGEVVVAPDAALVGLLDQGELEAIILGVDATGVQQFLGDNRQVVDLNEAFEDEFGFRAYYLGPVTTEEYAEGHCGEVRAYVTAIRDAILDIRENPDVWVEHMAAIGQPAEAAPTFQELYADNFITEWGEEQVEAMRELITTITPYLPDDFPADIPDGLWSLDYPFFED